jgi:hypothetical protein
LAKSVTIIKKLGESIPEEKMMVNREKVLEEIFELALQNDMNYFG